MLQRLEKAARTAFPHKNALISYKTLRRAEQLLVLNRSKHHIN
jgi:hypothetical protein